MKEDRKNIIKTHFGIAQRCQYRAHSTFRLLQGFRRQYLRMIVFITFYQHFIGTAREFF